MTERAFKAFGATTMRVRALMDTSYNMSAADSVASASTTTTLDRNGSDLRDLRSKMADEINCYTAEDIGQLAKVKLETLAYWRKHGRGPKPIRFGDAYLYPKNSVMEFISSLMDDRQDEFIRKCI